MTDWISGLIAEWGAVGVFLLMVLENIFPPIPSEVVLPLAGAEAAAGRISLGAAVIASTLGAIVGTLPFYLVARAVGTDGLKNLARRYGRIITLSPREIDQADAWFDRYGQYAVLFGRLVPGVRTLISIPAGISGMPYRRFLTFTAIGTFAWSFLLVMVGYVAGQDATVVENYLGPIGNVIILALLVLYVYRVATFSRQT